MRVYNHYIKGKNYITTSFVPKNSPELALKGSKLANVVEEKIVIGAESTFNPNVSSEYKKTSSSFDRSKEPDYGDIPSLNVPEVYQTDLDNGLKVYGIKNSEVPLVSFNLIIEGGQLLESMDKLGLSYLTAQLLNKGTRDKTVKELEEAIQELGASIYVSSNSESINISGTTLSKNYKATLLSVSYTHLTLPTNREV